MGYIGFNKEYIQPFVQDRSKCPCFQEVRACGISPVVCRRKLGCDGETIVSAKLALKRL